MIRHNILNLLVYYNVKYIIRIMHYNTLFNIAIKQCIYPYNNWTLTWQRKYLVDWQNKFENRDFKCLSGSIKCFFFTFYFHSMQCFNN